MIGRIAIPAALAAVLLTACSAAQDTSAQLEQSGVPEPAMGTGTTATGEVAPDMSQPGEASAVAADAADRSIVRTASVTVEVDEVGTSAARVREIAASLDGVVAQEDTALSDAAEPRSWLLVRIPSDSLDAALARLSELGEVIQQGGSSDDVTGQVVDLQARIQSQQASVERVRALLADAESLGDVVTIEAELTRRQADLEALQAQDALLADQVALASVSVTLTEPGATTGGFTDGLRAGWDAFVESARTLATGLGAVLPFLAALAVILLPIAVVLRSRSQNSKQERAETAEQISVES